MKHLRIGQTEICYRVRRSAKAAERHITVTPDNVEVLALSTDDERDIEAFLQRKRRWLFNTVRELEHKVSKRPVVPRFMTGSKIPFRGRMMKLAVRRHDGPQIAIGLRNGFFVDLPPWVKNDQTDEIVANEIKLWLKRRVRRDVQDIVAKHTQRFGLVPRALRVADMKTGWGSCGVKGTICINWHLIFAPRRVLEYVVVHELAHLKHRSHGKQFWKFIAEMMPEYASSKAWLDKHQGMLDSSFLNARRNTIGGTAV